MSMFRRSQDLIDAARACVDTPFHHQGRQPGVGLDCAGLLVVAMQSLGLSPLDRTDYSRTPHGGELESMLDAQPMLARVPIHDMHDGDVLLMRFEKEPQHLALHAGETIIHAYQTVGKVVEHRLDTRWRARIVRVYRVAGSVR